MVLKEPLEVFSARNIIKTVKSMNTGAELGQAQSKLGLAVRHLKLKFEVKDRSLKKFEIEET